MSWGYPASEAEFRAAVEDTFALVDSVEVTFDGQMASKADLAAYVVITDLDTLPAGNLFGARAGEAREPRCWNRRRFGRKDACLRGSFSRKPLPRRVVAALQLAGRRAIPAPSGWATVTRASPRSPSRRSARSRAT